MLTAKDYVPTPPLKRFFEIIIVLLLLVILAPFILFFILALLVEQMFSPMARGPLFYCEPRISGGKVIKFCKIRTCKKAAYDEEMARAGFIETVIVESHRDNFTRVGWWLKKVYLDEMPQLFSVITGDLSLVGPRPPNLKNYKEMIAQGIFTKSAIKGGLTGLYQSYKGHWDKSPNGQGGEFLDEEYVEFCRRHSPRQIVWFDLKIILRTIKVILEHRGI